MLQIVEHQPLAPPALQELGQAEFGVLMEAHRRALHGHCYRMLGSVQEAEELVQETFLRAWRRRETFAGRASLRAWLYKIATNLCLDTLERQTRRTLPQTRSTAATLDQPIPAALSESIWLEPFPDALLAGEEVNPAARIEQKESITLAFLQLLHRLPPRQRAVLLLRDVLDWPASEVADLLELSVAAVKSALYRARMTLTHGDSASVQAAPPSSPIDEQLRQQLARYVQAWEAGDPDALVALLKDEATFSMPPIPAWYQGRVVIRGLVAKTVFAGDAYQRWRLLPTRASGQTAFGLYRRDETGSHAGYGIQVVRFVDGEIADIYTVRNPALLVYFDLPQYIASAGSNDESTIGLNQAVLESSKVRLVG
jgi:RNA polymerase sigma-70 factor (ECF subfamily)